MLHDALFLQKVGCKRKNKTLRARHSLITNKPIWINYELIGLYG